MRADMARVIVERPRHGSRDKKARKGYRKEQQRRGWDEQLRRESIGERGRSRSLNEHLAPLRRFLLSCVGRPWNKVFAEICAHVNRNNAVQDHVRDHIDDIVERQVLLNDGVPCALGGHNHGQPLRSGSRWRLLYVCPKTGLLRRLEKPRPATQSRPKPKPIRVSETIQCHFLDGAWHLVEVEPLPLDPWRMQSEREDVLLERPVCKLTDEKAREVYGDLVFAVSKRRLSRRELSQWPIPR